jgi:hypothetical protein
MVDELGSGGVMELGSGGVMELGSYGFTFILVSIFVYLVCLLASREPKPLGHTGDYTHTYRQNHFDI